MNDHRQFYIGGKFVDPVARHDLPVVNPATEESFAVISLGSAEDVDRAVLAAALAFESYSQTTIKERSELLGRIAEVYQAKMEEMATTISREMGAPIDLARAAQAPAGLGHIIEARSVVETFEFDTLRGTTLMRKEPIGVCGLITPWNWPMNQIACKVAPALAAGCTMVLKPSEFAPLSALLFAEILHEAGVPAGVFNLINGDGPTVGAALASHPAAAMISITGSTRAGIAVANAAAATVKRVTQELGGKSANIILDDADLETAIDAGVQACFLNSGQSCDAPTRLLVHRSVVADACAVAKQVAEAVQVGDPSMEGFHLGPLVSSHQFERVQALIKAGIADGATLIAGGLGRPEGMNKGFFVKPTVFGAVRSDMRIAREEIFGPVLSIMSYENEDDAIRIANDTPYGLSAYVTSADLGRAQRVANRLRAGNVHLNYANLDFSACFGGYKQSGNGREWGAAGLNEFLELKAVFGHSPS
jgi:aldehyde dehydrogenase (NAD+)